MCGARARVCVCVCECACVSCVFRVCFVCAYVAVFGCAFQWRNYYGLKYSTTLLIILVLKVCIFCRQRNLDIVGRFHVDKRRHRYSTELSPERDDI